MRLRLENARMHLGVWPATYRRRTKLCVSAFSSDSMCTPSSSAGSPDTRPGVFCLQSQTQSVIRQLERIHPIGMRHAARFEHPDLAASLFVDLLDRHDDPCVHE